MYKKCSYFKVTFSVQPVQENPGRNRSLLFWVLSCHISFIYSRACIVCGRNICQTEHFFWLPHVMWLSVQLAAVRSKGHRAMTGWGGHRHVVPGMCMILDWWAYKREVLGQGTALSRLSARWLDTSSRECLVPWSDLILCVFDLAQTLASSTQRISPTGLLGLCYLETRL